MSMITYTSGYTSGDTTKYAIVNNEGALKVSVDGSSPPDGGIVSTVNSSTTPLLSGATFTGTGELNAYSDVMVQIKSDTNGTFYCEFSPDGTNWDTSLSFKYNTTRINAPHKFVKGYRYFRIRFVNEGGDQSVFRLNVYYGSFGNLTAPINGLLSENYDATIVRTTDYKYEVAMGKRQGRTLWNKFGYNDDIDTASGEVIMSAGGTFNRLVSASTISVVSTSVNDIDGGTGVHGVVIYGVDGNYRSVTEVVLLNGTTPVITTNTFLGINRMATYRAGSSFRNIGRITAIATSDSSTQTEIPIGEGTSQSAIFYVQENHTILMDWLIININKIAGGSAPVVTIRAWVYSSVSNAEYQVFKYIMDTSVENHLDLTPSQPFVVAEKSVIWFTAETNVNNTSANCRFSLIEERNI